MASSHDSVDLAKRIANLKYILDDVKEGKKNITYLFIDRPTLEEQNAVIRELSTKYPNYSVLYREKYVQTNGDGSDDLDDEIEYRIILTLKKPDQSYSMKNRYNHGNKK